MPSAFTGGMQKPCPCGGGSGLVGSQAQGGAADDFNSGAVGGVFRQKEVAGFGDVI